MPGRSYEKITVKDLRRLRDLAEVDREAFFLRNPVTASLYSKRVFAVALCQGAALHYVNKTNGVKDFDVWTFYRTHPTRMFPPRRRGIADFGDPKFGTTASNPTFVGRRVDLIGRSIQARSFADPVEVLRQYLRTQPTTSAKFLAQKAVVLLEPAHLLGTVIWPE